MRMGAARVTVSQSTLAAAPRPHTPLVTTHIAALPRPAPVHAVYHRRCIIEAVDDGTRSMVEVLSCVCGPRCSF